MLLDEYPGYEQYIELYAHKPLGEWFQHTRKLEGEEQLTVVPLTGVTIDHDKKIIVYRCTP